MSPTSLLTTGSAILGLYVLLKIARIVYNELTSPIRFFPGPRSNNALMGHLRDILDAAKTALQESWIENYGPTIKIKTVFGRSRLYTTDTKAINHIIMNSFTYYKPKTATYDLRRVLGEGVLLTEGEVHKNQRRILNPAFGPSQIQELTPIFMEKAIALRDAWSSELQESTSGTAKVDALSWLSKMTLDVIGKAGFDYEFHSLSGVKGRKSDLSSALETMLKVGSTFSAIGLLRAVVPILRFLPVDRDAEVARAREILFRVGREMVEDKKILSMESDGNGAERKSLLSLLVRANTAKNIPEHQRMSDDDVVSQIPTFIVAGHETTSTATTWAIYALTKDKAVQTRLREELLGVSTDDPTMEELNSLPYLDAVIRETLRLHAPVAASMRAAVKDDILPLEVPIVDTNGVTHHSIRITEGQLVVIPILLINRLKTIWGQDAHEFNPDRWIKIPDAATRIPGVWGNMLTFLGGPHACIGYRFTLIEMKAILFTLIRAFEFDLAVSHDDILQKSEVVTRPVIKGDPNNTNQLPVVIRPISQQ